MTSTSQATSHKAATVPIMDRPQSAVQETIDCPVCHTACVDEPLYRYAAAESAAHFCPPTRSADRFDRLERCIKRLWQGDECVVMRCRECGFAFGFPFVGGDEEFYQILHEQRHYPSSRWDYDFAMQEAFENFAGGKALDIGAGVGMFLRKLSDDWERYAVEGSNTTRRDLQQSGVTVFTDLADAVPVHAGTFQAITLFQVLEHVAEFPVILDQCRQLVAPNGRLVITVPDCDAMIRQEHLTGSPDMPPNHINKWTPDSLARALAQAGFSSSQAVYEPPSWKNLRSNLHMRLGTDATNSGTWAAQAYRVKSRPLRIAALSVLGCSALVRLLPAGGTLRAGGAFGMVGTLDRTA